MKHCIKFLFLILLLIFAIPSYAETKHTATIQQSQENDKVSFQIAQAISLSNGVFIPENSIVNVDILDIQDERRWHKSAYLVATLSGYLTEPDAEYKNMENTEIYMLIRKYEPIDKKQMGKTAVELGATTAASFVIPGVDIAYYFTKGMIKKKEDKTRFMSGVSTAYENSIFWFWLKGKSLDLNSDIQISLREINKEKALKLTSDIEKRKENSIKMEQRKEAVKEFMSY